MHPVRSLTRWTPLSFLAAVAISFAYCGNEPEQTPVGAPVDSLSVHPVPDTAGLTEFVQSVYRWRYTDTPFDHIIEFEGVQQHPKDTLYTHIDFAGQDSIVRTLRQTGFFSEKFISHYQRIGKRMDQDLSSGKAEWMVGDMWPWYEADPWLLSQDIPAKAFWDQLTIANVTISKQEVSFNWTAAGSSPYIIKAVKENNHWKITYLQGYDLKNIFGAE